MDTETLSSLENAMFNSADVDGDDYSEVVRAWMDENEDYVDGLRS